MRIGIAVALCALVLPAVAPAKGPTAATITGPGLASPIELGGTNGWRQGSPMEALVSEGGFFQVVWGGEPYRVLAKTPTTRLGPKYRIVYVVPGPSGKDDRIRQDLYPYAKGGALTYVAPGQRFFDTRRTQGGWFRPAPRLRRALVQAGLPAAPASPPAVSPSDGRWLPWLTAILLVAALAGAAVLPIRRRVVARRVTA